MIRLDCVSMRYPVPKRYRDWLLAPTKRPRTHEALRGVSLRVPEGGSIGLLGPNGAGKTSLLKLIGGLLYPTTGSVSVNGHDTRRHNLETRSAVGFVLNEDRSFYWRLTGVQNLRFFGTLDNLPAESLMKRIFEVMESTGLSAARDRRVSDYSSGMRQRLAAARALMAKPGILLLDEPTKSLDPLGAAELRSLIARDIHCEGRKTLVLATHQIQEAEALCEEVHVLSGGRIVASGRTDDVKRRPGGLQAFYEEAVAEAASCPC